MLKAKLTSEGQVTIPTAIRLTLGLEAGDELLFFFAAALTSCTAVML